MVETATKSEKEDILPSFLSLYCLSIHLSVHPFIHPFSILIIAPLFYTFQYFYFSLFFDILGQTSFSCLEGRGRSQRERCMSLDVITIYVVQLLYLCSAAVMKDIKIIHFLYF